MRTTRSIFAALFAVALALPFAACETQETEFEETPPAQEETETFEDRDGTMQQPQQPQNGAMDQQQGTGQQQY